jgi:predicted nucleic acid-binding protein
VTTAWLIDKSAIGRLHLAVDADAWADRIERGLVRISTVTRLEIGFSARSGSDHRTVFAEPPLASMPIEYLTPLIEDRAVAIQSALAERGRHRAPSIPDLLIAATAELAELTVLHIDKDFELIAAFTGQTLERLELR